MLAAVPATALVFWPPMLDGFMLPKATVAVVVAVLSLAFAAARGVPAIQRNGGWQRPRPFALVLLALFLALLSATVSSTHLATSVVGQPGRWTGIVAYGAMLWLGYSVVQTFRPRDVPLIIEVALLAAGPVLAYALLQMAGLDPFGWSAPGQASQPIFSTFGNSNFLSAYLAVMLPFAVGWAIWSPGWRRMYGIGFALIALLALPRIGADQGFLAGLPAVLLVGLVALRRRAPWLRRLFDSRVLAALTVASLTLVGIAWWRLAPELTNSLDVGARQRLLLWRAATEMFADRPLLGHGLDTYGTWFTQYQPVEHAVTFEGFFVDAPHSVPLWMLTSGGLVLTAAYVAAVGYVGYRLLRGLQDETDRTAAPTLAMLGGAWVAYHLQSLVSMEIPTLGVLHWVVAGAIVVMTASDVAAGPNENSKARRKAKKARRRSLNQQLAPSYALPPFLIAVLLTWVVSAPLRADVAAARGVALAASGAPPAAFLAKFDRATQLAPWNPTYWAEKATALNRVGNISGALQAQEQAARVAPGEPDHAINSARLAAAADRTDRVGDWLAEAVQRSPRDPAVFLEAATFFADVGHDEKANRIARAGLELGPPAEVRSRLQAIADR